MAFLANSRFFSIPVKQRFTISIGIMLLLIILSVSNYLFHRKVIASFEEAHHEAVVEMHSLAILQKMVLEAAMPVNDYLIHADVSEIEAAQLGENHRKLEELSQKDGLTGIYNKRMFLQVLQENVERFQRYGHPFSLLMMDLDHFKNVNDTYGHLAGDDVLKAVAGIISKQIRTVDHVARYGGEEMTVLLTEIAPEAAMAKAEQIRAAVGRLNIAVSDSKTINVTVSIGVASLPADADSGQGLVACADDALYAAKRAGRNRGMLCGESAGRQP